MKAILLAGGKGSRLRPLTVHTPKPIVPIFNRPFLYYQIDLLRQVPEIDEVILSLNYQPRRIEEIFGDGEGLGLKLRYVVEPMPLGTGGAIRYAGDSLTDSVVVFNGDVLTAGRSRRRCCGCTASGKAKATIVLTPVENPRAYGLVETDAAGNVLRFLEKPGEDEITCNTINAGIYVLEPDTFDRIPKDTAWSIERSFFPSLIERGETFVAYVYDGYWIDIGTPAKYLQVHRDIMDGLYAAPPFAGDRATGLDLADGAHRRGRRAARALLRRRGRGDQGRQPRHALRGDRPADARRRVGGHRRVDRLAERVDRARSGGARLDPRPQLPRRPQRRARIAGRPRRQDGHYRLQQTLMEPQATLTTLMTPINTHIFKAYDVRGLYPVRDRRSGSAADRPRLRPLPAGEAHRVSRDMRLSSPSVAAAFIEGAREQGADVVDYGMLATDMMYFAVARDGLDGGAQITASHNPKQYNGIKMVRKEAFPLSGDAGIGDIRDMIGNGTIGAPAAVRGA